jgi:hypothetical protein
MKSMAVSFINVTEDFHEPHTLKILSKACNKKLVKIALPNKHSYKTMRLRQQQAFLQEKVSPESIQKDWWICTPHQIGDVNRETFLSVYLGARERWAFAVRAKYDLCFDSVDAFEFV